MKKWLLLGLSILIVVIGFAALNNRDTPAGMTMLLIAVALAWWATRRPPAPMRRMDTEGDEQPLETVPSPRAEEESGAVLSGRQPPPIMHSPQPPRHSPPPPVDVRRPPKGKPIESWGKATIYTEVAGEFAYATALAQVLRSHNAYPSGDDAYSSVDDLPVLLAPNPKNPHDGNAVEVWSGGKLIGHLSREDARAYTTVLQDLEEQGLVLLVRGRVWASASEDYDGKSKLRASVNLRLPKVSAVQSFNTLPEEPHVVLPRGRAIQATGEDQHMDVLGRYVADGERHIAVTLHLVHEQKTARSAITELVEIRLDGERVGVLTKGMSNELRDVVAYVDRLGKIPVSRAVLKGSQLKADIVLDVGKTTDISQKWLDGITGSSQMRV